MTLRRSEDHECHPCPPVMARYYYYYYYHYLGVFLSSFLSRSETALYGRHSAAQHCFLACTGDCSRLSCTC